LKRGSLPSFYRRRTINSNIYQRPAKPVAPPPPPRTLLTPPCPSKSLKSLDNQLYRQDSNSIDSPQIARHDVFLKEPLR
jgi:hypothetical protein